MSWTSHRRLGGFSLFFLCFGLDIWLQLNRGQKKEVDLNEGSSLYGGNLINRKMIYFWILGVP